MYIVDYIIHCIPSDICLAFIPFCIFLDQLTLPHTSIHPQHEVQRVSQNNEESQNF